jgi:hypothetical protein
MDYENLLFLKKQPAWRLLCIDSAPLVIGFLKRSFVEQNQSAIGQEHLTAMLDDYIYDIHQKEGEGKYPKMPKEYLEDWANENNNFLRKYYPGHEEQAVFDLTPSTEKAIEWVDSLQEKNFIGTESRLLTIIDLLKSIIDESTTDPKERIKQLEKEKAFIEKQIAEVKNGQLLVSDGVKIRERYYQAEETAKSLIRDFRQVEDNFRVLDKTTRKKITLSELPKGALLDDIFGEHNQIEHSDQGKSFTAFMQLLMSNIGQTELDQLTNAVDQLDEVKALNPERFLVNIKNHLIEAGDKVKRTRSHLIEQLKIYLDDQVWLENQRVVEVIKKIEKKVMNVDDELLKEKYFTNIDDTKPSFNLPMMKKLYRPSQRPIIKSQKLTQGRAEANTDVLFKQYYVDIAKLQSNIERCLQQQDQINLQQLCKKYPIKKGLSELIAYVNLATKNENSTINRKSEVLIEYSEGKQKQSVTLPEIIFSK